MVVDLRGGGYIEIDGEKINADGRFTKPEWPSVPSPCGRGLG
jgi:hypothetical protein